eukprot:1592910-Amphidinium_carterae.2
MGQGRMLAAHLYGLANPCASECGQVGKYAGEVDPAFTVKLDKVDQRIWKDMERKTQKVMHDESLDS